MKHLENALRKAQLFNPHRSEWTGCFIPSEILALVQAGAIPSQYIVELAQLDKNTGQSSRRWFYFFPGKLSLPLQHRHDKKDT